MAATSLWLGAPAPHLPLLPIQSSAQMMPALRLCAAAMMMEAGSLQGVRHWTMKLLKHTALRVDTECAPKRSLTKQRALAVALIICGHGHLLEVCAHVHWRCHLAI